MSTVFCCVPGCRNGSRTTPGRLFFTITTDERREEWLRLISREDLKPITDFTQSHKICEEHFKGSYIIHHNSKITLQKNALPSKKLPRRDDTEFTRTATPRNATTSSSKWTQTKIQSDDGKASNSISPLSTTASTHEKFYSKCDKLNSELAAIFKADRTAQRLHDLLDSPAYTHFMFNLYQTSPQAYHFFQNIYGLVNSDVLLKQFIHLNSDGNDSVMMTLKSRIDKMPAKEKNCSVLVRSMELKANLCYNIKEDKIYGFQDIDGVQYTEPSTFALIVMIRGLLCNWKQPIGYLMISSNQNKQLDVQSMIKNWMDNLVMRLFDIGLNVRTLVLSTRHEWINDILCVKSMLPDSPYYFVNNKKIFYIFNPPELVKAVHDCLLTHDIHFQNKVAKYEDIVNFYEADKNKMVPYANQLTENHFNTRGEDELLNKYAIQLMSKTVAHGMWNYINLNFIKNGSVGTVDLINNVNDLFDILNMSKQNQCDKGRKRIFCKENGQEGLLPGLKNFFENLKVINRENTRDVTPSMTFVKYILGTINATSLLHEELKNEGYSVLLTKNLHQNVLNDYIRKMILCIKKRPEEPSALQFTVAFRRHFLKYLKILMSSGSSENEVLKLLAEISSVHDKIARNEIIREPPMHNKTNESRMTIFRGEYDFIDSPGKHSVMYVSSYILLKISKRHPDCQIFKNYLLSHVYEPSTKEGKFQRYNQYVLSKKGHIYEAPCDNILQLIEQLDEIFVTAFSNKTLCENIAESLYNVMENINFENVNPCDCFPKEYLIKLFIRIKIFYVIRLNNKLFKRNKETQHQLQVPKLL